MTFKTFGISGFRDFVFLLTNARFNFPWTLTEMYCIRGKYLASTMEYSVLPHVTGQIRYKANAL
jgi:hypothetical protein